MADLDCDNSTAEISWSPANGANSYMVTAVAADGYRASCETTEHQCELMELECGQTYGITLTSISDHCETETRTNVSISTREWSSRVVKEEVKTRIVNFSLLLNIFVSYL